MYKTHNNDLQLIFTLYVINIILYFITFSWIVLLEKNKCDCGKNWKRDFIKYYILAMIVFTLMCAIYEKMASYNMVNNYDFIFDKLWYILFVSQIVFVTVVFIYIRDLIKNKCKCEESNSREVSSLYSFIDMLIFIITCIMAFGYITCRFIS
jgi:hypothetical protein